MKLRSFVAVFLFIKAGLAISITRVPNNNHALDKHLIENQLPITNQTHEVIMIPNTRVLLISQMSDSVLVKARVSEDGYIEELAAFQMESPTSALHGLANSEEYPGKVWLTLQMENKLVLIDPMCESVEEQPDVLQVIDVPKPGNGPHYVGEYGDELWVSLQTSFDVLRINHRDPTNYSIYHGVPHPVFVAQHPINKNFYSGQDDSSEIIKIDPTTGETKQLKIPADIGQPPVGTISGPLGVWFTLLGTTTNGTGTLGRIGAGDDFTWFKLTSNLGSNASLLHLAFDVDHLNNFTLWVLSSSINDPTALDMIIKLTFDPLWSKSSLKISLLYPLRNVEPIVFYLQTLIYLQLNLPHPS